MASDDIIISRKRIAHQLGCSVKTVSRRFANGDLPGVFKVGGRTSPLKTTKYYMNRLTKRRGK